MTMTTKRTPLPKIVSQQEWQAAHDQLLAKEKAATAARDALAAWGRECPHWMDGGRTRRRLPGSRHSGPKKHGKKHDHRKAPSPPLPSWMSSPPQAISTGITCCTPHAPTCSGESGPRPRRRKATGEHWHL